MTIINLRDGMVSSAESFDNAVGRKSHKKAGLGRLINDSQSAQRERKMIRVKSKAGARVGRADAKNKEAIAKQLMADASKEGVKGDIALGNALAVSAPGPEASSSMSPTVKYVLIGLAALVVVGGGGFAIYKMTKK